ncbi:OB-fold nucleic acid binding domain-containing protein [Nonomuraea sp. NPDC049784]|uniref:OB-fold nucleic acid binding domain-containing protein n=1 Tax=Nonomuraea sp. NPDC049784 TaxID=3154361 RepID=UPI0033E7DB88
MNEHAHTAANGFTCPKTAPDDGASGDFLVLPLDRVHAMPKTWHNAFNVLLDEYQAAYAHTTPITYTVHTWETRPLADCTPAQLRSISVILADDVHETADQTGPARHDGPRTTYRDPDGRKLEEHQLLRVPYDAPPEHDAQPYNGEPYITTAAVLKLSGSSYDDDTEVHLRGEIVDLVIHTRGEGSGTYNFADVLLRDHTADLIVQIPPRLYPQVAELVVLGQRLIVTGSVDRHAKIPQLIASELRRQETAT